VMLWKPRAPPRENAISNVVMMGEWRGLGHPVFSPDGKLLAGSSRTGGIQLWELATGRATLHLKTEGLPAGFSPDGRSLLVLDERGISMREWELATQTPGRKAAYREAIDHAVLSADQQRFAQLSGETQLVVRSAVTGSLLFGLPENIDFRPDGQTQNFDFCPDGHLLAIAKSDGTAKMWDLSDRSAPRVVWKAEFGDRDGVNGLTLSPDGKLFATGTWSGPIKIYDARTRKELRTLTGHKAEATFVAFSSDSRTLASASNDSTVRLWNLATAREMARMNVVPTVRFLGFSPDAETLAVGEANDIVRLLRAPPMS
jgi:WD40 repeat protein